MDRVLQTTRHLYYEIKVLNKGCSSVAPNLVTNNTKKTKINNIHLECKKN